MKGTKAIFCNDPTQISTKRDCKMNDYFYLCYTSIRLIQDVDKNVRDQLICQAESNIFTTKQNTYKEV